MKHAPEPAERKLVCRSLGSLRTLRRFAAALCLIASAATVPAAEFELDPAHTSIYFAVSHDDISFVRGRFAKTSGRIDFDVGARTGRVVISVGSDSIDTGNRQLDNVLRSQQFLDADHFPEVHFVGERFVFEDGKLIAVDGTLTLLSVQRPLRLKAHRFACRGVASGLAHRDVCGGAFVATFKRSDFGMTRFLSDVGDEVELVISVEATRL